MVERTLAALLEVHISQLHMTMTHLWMSMVSFCFHENGIVKVWFRHALHYSDLTYFNPTGNIRQPKYGHLKQLHSVLTSMEKHLLYGQQNETSFDDKVKV
jgi:hypothetical protein